MVRKSPSAYNQELTKLIAQYEAAKKENKQIYLDADQLADIADKYACERRFREAQEVIDYGFHLHTGNTSLLLEQAFLYLDTHKIRKAQEVVDQISEGFSPEVKLLKAEILLNEGLLEAAKEILNTINEPNELENIIDIIYLYLDMGYPEAAQEWIEKGKIRYNENEEFMTVNADYLTTIGQFDIASSYFDQLIDIEPYNASYWVGLAKCRFAQEDCEKTIEACDFALAADESYGDAYAYRAHSYFYLNNTDEAIADYTKAMEYKAVPPEMGYMFIGMAYNSKEEWENANECYQKVIQIFDEKGDVDSPLLIDTYTNAAIACIKLGNSKEAHILCKKAKSINPNESTIYATEGRLYLIEGLEKKASKCFKEATKNDSSIEIRYQIASAYSEVELLTKAKQYFEEVYKLDPQYTDIAEKLSVLCLMHNEIDDFFKYNSECTQPINEDMILDLLAHHENTDEGKKLLWEVLERMKKEK